MTALEVFNMTMDLIDEKLDSGLVDPNTTANYKVRALGTLTMLQNELCRLAPLYKTLDITASGTSGYVQVVLPVDYLSIYQILDNDLNLYDGYKIVGNDLYVPFNFNGKLVYKYIPATITKLDDNLVFDNMICTTVLANGLATQLLLNDNTNLADYFNQRYEELKRTIKTKQPSAITKRKDLYDATLKF